MQGDLRSNPPSCIPRALSESRLFHNSKYWMHTWYFVRKLLRILSSCPRNSLGSCPVLLVSIRTMPWICLGLARTIYVRCTYGIFGLGITKYTVYIYVYIRFWLTLYVTHLVVPVKHVRCAECIALLCFEDGGDIFQYSHTNNAHRIIYKTSHLAWIRGEYVL